MSDQKVTFTKEQIQWLENEFPEAVWSTSESTLIHTAGQRSVLARIKSVSKVEVHFVPVHSKTSW
jgi:hypothetical protein